MRDGVTLMDDLYLPFEYVPPGEDEGIRWNRWSIPDLILPEEWFWRDGAPLRDPFGPPLDFWPDEGPLADPILPEPLMDGWVGPGRFNPTPAESSYWQVGAKETSATGNYVSWRCRLLYVFDGELFVTFFRVNVPVLDPSTMLDPDHLGIVLFVEGGGVDQMDLGVREREADETGCYETFRRLASGMAGEEPARDTGFTYRDGDPVVTVYFTQPGRGAGTFRASPALGYEDDAPDNTTDPAESVQGGRDVGGAQMLEVMDLVMMAATSIVEEMLPGFDHRIVVLSSSMGLFGASRWVAETTSQVWAHIDYEGPTRSEELMGLYNNTDWMCGSLTFGGWSTWLQENPTSFYFIFRPPVDVLDLVPDAIRVTSIGGAFDPFLGWLADEVDADGRPVRPYWERYYAGGAWRETCEASYTYWADREPEGYLGAETARGVAYLRIQGEKDHAATLEGFGLWKGLGALLAAFGGGTGDGYVFLADAYYITATRDSPFPVTVGVGEVEFPKEVQMKSELRTWLQVDLVRWALQQASFPLP